MTRIYSIIRQKEMNFVKAVIIDDDRLSLLTIKGMLEEMDINNKCFNNPKKAMKYIHRNSKKIDLILCDYLMPRINGLNIYNEIKDLNIEFILISSINVDSSVRQLQKPICFNELKNKILSLKIVSKTA